MTEETSLSLKCHPCQVHTLTERLKENNGKGGRDCSTEKGSREERGGIPMMDGASDGRDEPQFEAPPVPGQYLRASERG